MRSHLYLANIDFLSNREKLEKKITQQQAMNYTTPPSVPDKYRKESFSDNQSTTKEYSNSTDSRNSNRHQSKTIFENKSFENGIELGIKEIENGAENIRKGVEQIGEKMKRDLRINL